MILLDQIENLIKPLKKSDVPEFGLMTAQHMVEHLTLTVKISYGRIKLPEFQPSEKNLKLKEIVMSDNFEFPRGVKAPGLGDKLMPLKYQNLKDAKDALLESISSYQSYWEGNPMEQNIHPRFGYLNRKEWDHFHDRHFKHHLKQFRLI